MLYNTITVSESTKKHDVEKVRRKGGVKETHLMALPFISSMYYMVHWAHGKTRDK